MVKTTKLDKVQIKPGEFGLAIHKYQMFNAVVPMLLNRDELESTDNSIWQMVANKLSAGDEVRVLSEDCSFRAVVLITYVYGTDVRAKVVEYTPLDVVDYSKLQNSDDYFVQLRGVKKWCVIKRETGELLKDMLATHAEAVKYLEDHRRALVA